MMEECLHLLLTAHFPAAKAGHTWLLWLLAGKISCPVGVVSSQWARTCGCETVHPHHLLQAVHCAASGLPDGRRYTTQNPSDCLIPHLGSTPNPLCGQVSPLPLVPTCSQPRLVLPFRACSSLSAHCREVARLTARSAPVGSASSACHAWPVFLDCILSLCCNLRHGPFLVIHRDLPLLAMLHTNLD